MAHSIKLWHGAENYRNALALGYDKYAYLGMARIHIRRNNRDKAFKILSMLAEKEPGDPRIASEFKAFAEKYPELISDIPTAVTVA